ncbi:hypothetical protein [Methanocella conradii]|nr:hypothetical protein [Methanocella conradii]MDI6895822.1 hypothetical protein [Methanocella conradii]
MSAASRSLFVSDELSLFRPTLMCWCSGRLNSSSANFSHAENLSSIPPST